MQLLKYIKTTTLSTYAKDVLHIIAGSLFLSIASQIAIPFFPVPLTMQTFAVMMLALMFGKTKATLAVVAYLGEVFMGLPVLANMTIEPLALFGLRGGYLFGFVAQAYLSGVIFERSNKFNAVSMFMALMLVSFVQIGMGALWLGTFIGASQALALGATPFILGAIAKVIAITAIAKAKN